MSLVSTHLVRLSWRISVGDPMIEGLLFGILCAVIGGIIVYGLVWWSMFDGWRR